MVVNIVVELIRLSKVSHASAMLVTYGMLNKFTYLLYERAPQLSSNFSLGHPDSL